MKVIKKPKKVYKIILRNVDTLKETFLFKIHKYWFWVYFWILILAVMGLSFYLFNTSFSKFVNPFHFYGVSKEKFNTMIRDLDELEKKAEQNTKYIELLQKIIREGHIEGLNDEEFKEIKIKNDEKKQENQTLLVNAIFKKPIDGEMVSPYKIDEANKKITMKGKAKSDVYAVFEGYVISVIRTQPLCKVVILHDNGITSVYHCKNVSIVENQSVSTGQTIGNLGTLAAEKEYNFIFELYLNGQAVDPNDFIDF